MSVTSFVSRLEAESFGCVTRAIEIGASRSQVADNTEYDRRTLDEIRGYNAAVRIIRKRCVGKGIYFRVDPRNGFVEATNETPDIIGKLIYSLRNIPD